ncbi:MAG: acyl-ACP--UDP-N-acetylglucosamine O-acyltransferase [Acidobacteria bacterium]|nr:acyl-ACP--UDP-N-acetylglucosamine O-acyltransferase [Acidobacteriota bacterium]MBV9437646.1 acyl-ACP--UDP-N-acetylglucosamine O-acyltransferase [Acidobacteriota bacterium]
MHPTAIVDPAAVIPSSCKIGPFCIVGKDVEMGENCELLSHVVLKGPTKMGSRNRVFPFTTLGLEPQDLKFKGEPTRLEIGDNNVIRESVTIHRGTPGGGGVTRVGSHCLIMAYSHIAHDCSISDNVIMANAATLAGHVTVEEYAVVGALCPVHQFVRIGAYSYIGGGTTITQDVLPFSLTSAKRDVHAFGMNSVGLERKGFSKERLRKIHRAYRTLLSSRMNIGESLEKLKSESDLGEDVERLIRFVEGSQRGILK